MRDHSIVTNELADWTVWRGKNSQTVLTVMDPSHRIDETKKKKKITLPERRRFCGAVLKKSKFARFSFPVIYSRFGKVYDMKHITFQLNDRLFFSLPVPPRCRVSVYMYLTLSPLRIHNA